MNSRQRILEHVRSNEPPAIDLPSLEGDWIAFENLREQFTSAVESVGGQVAIAANREQADQQVRQLAVCQQVTRAYSHVPGIGPSNVDLEVVEAPRELADLDVVIAEGKFAVAENGAVWVSGQGLRQRAVLFICQHLVLIVPADQIIHNMHEAYERLTGDSGCRSFSAGFGVFISGPSKTADIEQSLVIGAQGPRSLCVVLVEST